MKNQPLWWLLMITFCWFCLYNHIFVVSGLCLEDQQSLLLQLKNNLKYESEESNKLVSWDQSIACCQWSGITCDEEGHVTGLDLSEENIYGGFDNSTSLFALRNLQLLNLAHNDFFGSVIPSGFNNLRNLTYLNLSYAGFLGQIPIEISHLTRLVTLDISSWHFFLKLENPNLGKLVQNLTRIRQLYLDGVNISAQGKEWGNAVLLLPSLQELSMSGCNLWGPLDSSLTRLKNLSVIRLDDNNLSSPVSEAFANFQNLATLSFVCCELIGIFPMKIFQVTSLSEIDISININLHGSLPDFPFNGQLHTLIVGATSFSGALPISISNLRHLSILDLSLCHFDRMLPNSMSRLTKLTHLDLSNNNFSGTVPPLNKSKNLIHLDLSHNDFTSSITSAHLGGLTKLMHIDLQDNFLNESIPLSLFSLPLLHSIELSNNNFQGQLDEFLNISSTMLEILDLSMNRLEGPIPASIVHLTSLSILQMSSNKFNGTIHLDMLQRLENLIVLDLSYNNLLINTNVAQVHVSSFPRILSVKLASCNLTEFPSFLRNYSMSYLDLSSNHIQGSIPTWIWQLGSLYALNLSHNLLTKFEGPVQNFSAMLTILDLHSNQLEGKLPISPLTNKTLYLDYSNNYFSSTIPSYFSNYLHFTLFLSLSENNLFGSIPQSMCNFSNIIVLDFSYNLFRGTIPQCLPQTKSLKILNFGNNMLNGNIPDTFLESCDLRSLDLHDNQLGGPIPNSISNCTALEVLNLGNNKIDDKFPCLLKNLSRLRVIVLRENKFHGLIGCPMTNNTWHMLQIVDLAFNNFSGSLQGQVFKAWEIMMRDGDHDIPKFKHTQPQYAALNGMNYQVSVTLTSKGLQLEFIKIPTILTCIDFSSNNLEGPISKELMNFTGLHILNLSHNAFTSHIPSSIGNLKQLESLDLSCNHFSGEIPTQLANLNFLSYLNLSFNHLVGRIPTGTQLQSFDANSFEGNDGLYGPPLTQSPNGPMRMLSPPRKQHTIEWKFLSAELGFIFGLGLIIGPLMLWKQWRQRYWKLVDRILCYIFPQLHLEYKSHRGQVYQVLRWRN